MKAAVIFDLYGTLLHLPQNSRPFHRLARRMPDGKVRSALKLAMTTDNPTLAKYASRIRLPSQVDISALDAALRNDIAKAQLFSDVVQTLAELKRQGLLTAVISNLSSPYKQPFFSHQLTTLFDVAVFSCDCGLIKPDPKIYELTLKHLGTPAQETLMVGDSFTADVDGPSRVGIIGVHLVRSGVKSKATRVISSLQSVPRLMTSF